MKRLTTGETIALAGLALAAFQVWRTSRSVPGVVAQQRPDPRLPDPSLPFTDSVGINFMQPDGTLQQFPATVVNAPQYMAPSLGDNTIQDAAGSMTGLPIGWTGWGVGEVCA